MRTKLDEIVEEELRKRDEWLGHTKIVPDPIALRIAERAFRHGVERAIAATDVISGHTFNFDGIGWMNAVEMGVDAARKQMANVQPAHAIGHAEEKLPPRPCNFCSSGRECLPGNHCCGHCISQQHGPESGCSICNRRKGERRKGYESRALLYTDPKATGIYGILDTHWLVDRRSGKDRRGK